MRILLTFPLAFSPTHIHRLSCERQYQHQEHALFSGFKNPLFVPNYDRVKHLKISIFLEENSSLFSGHSISEPQPTASRASLFRLYEILISTDTYWTSFFCVLSSYPLTWIHRNTPYKSLSHESFYLILNEPHTCIMVTQNAKYSLNVCC